jgi:predicted dehydrogenase
MSSMPVRIIHVGLGGWGGDWARNAIPPVTEIEVAAIVEPNPVARESAQKDLGIPSERAFSSLTDALAAVEADAVVITAPAVTHVPLAIEALEAGKHVLVEKPFANSTADAVAAVELAAQRGLILQVSQNYRWYPAPRLVKQLLADGAVGEIATIDIDFRQWDNDRGPEHPHYAFPHAMITDMAIHHFDLIRMLTGREAVRVYAKASYPSFSKYVDEAVAAMIIELEGGLVVSYRGSWLHRGPHTPWSGEWTISGEEGELTFASREADSAKADRVAFRHSEAEKPKQLQLETLPFIDRSGGLQAFAHSVVDGSEPETSGRDNLRSLAIMEAALRSAESGQPEQVVDPLGA